MAFSQLTGEMDNKKYLCSFKLAQLGVQTQTFYERSACLQSIYIALSDILIENDIDDIQLYPSRWPRAVHLSLNNEDAKNKLLIEGIDIQGKHIEVHDEYGSPIIRVTIQDAPFTVENEELKHIFSDFGDILRIEYEMLSVNGKTTGCKTGNRIVTYASIFQEIPSSVTINHQGCPVTVGTWYRERAMSRRAKVCSQCGSHSHTENDCEATQKLCFVCKNPGHTSHGCPQKQKKRVYQREDDNTVCFMGEGSTLSNFCTKFPIEINDQKYICNEQYIVQRKALLFDDHESARQVMQMEDPRQMYQLGKRVKNFDQRKWKAERYGIVKRCNRVKYSTHEGAKNDLLATGEKTIAEATSDLYWGIGMPITNTDVMDTDLWDGVNAMGSILEEIRRELQDKRVDSLIEEAKPTPDSEKKWAIIIGDSNCHGVVLEDVPFHIKKLSEGGLKYSGIEQQFKKISTQPADVLAVVLHVGTCEFSEKNHVNNIYAEYVESVNATARMFPNAEILLSSVPPRAMRTAQPMNKQINANIAELNQKLKELTLKEQNISLIDNDNGLKDNDDNVFEMMFNLADENGVHLSREGVHVLSDKIREGLIEAYYKIKLETEHDVVPSIVLNE